MKVVLSRVGPSDHEAFICDLRVQHGPLIRACTYNVNHGSDAEDLKHVFGLIIETYLADVILLQEVKRRGGSKKDPVRALRKMGYHVTYAKPEFAIALDKDEWEFLRSYRPLMSPTKYWTMNYALVVIARHKRTGKIGKFISYHPPAHVQAPKHKTFKVVSRVIREWKRRLDRIARRNFDAGNERNGGIDFVVSGGDDNVDESKGFKPPHGGWAFMVDGPLNQIQPPSGTHGGRKIDDLRVSENVKTVFQ